MVGNYEANLETFSFLCVDHIFNEEKKHVMLYRIEYLQVQIITDLSKWLRSIYKNILKKKKITLVSLPRRAIGSFYTKLIVQFK